MIRVDSLWLSIEPTDMRSGAERLLGQRPLGARCGVDLIAGRA